MIATVLTFLLGVLFALGLGIAGMTQPQKVVGFLNLVGEWDPSLAFVMVGAASVYLLSHRVILRRSAPLFDQKFLVPTRSEINRPLVTGAALFGVGWGLVGFCPGPVLVATATGNANVFLFVGAMALGMYVFDAWDARRQSAAPQNAGVGQEA